MTACKTEISALMAAALEMAQAHGGKLVRSAGGYWSWEGCPRQKHNGLPVEYFGMRTIHGLVTRRRFRYSEWREGREKRFPIAVQMVEEAAQP